MPEIVVTVRYNTETKALNVDGPIQDRILTYGMLEMAKDIVHEFNLEQGRAMKETPIMSPHGIVLPPLKKTQ